MTKLAFILASTLGTALLVFACSSSTDEPGADPSEGGAAGAAGNGTAATNPDGCIQHADCKSFGDCQTLEDIRATECGNDDYTTYVTVCGGTYVEFMGSATASSWLFDANGQPIGASFEDESTCSYWGSTCGPTGPGRFLCVTECISHDTCAEWGANFGCPATLDDLPEYCEFGIDIERQRSGCGGTIVDANNGIQYVTWTFDESDRLVAFRSVGDTRDCDYWGTECDKPPIGKPELLCVGTGEGGRSGQGSSGAGGVGGAEAAGAGGTAGAGGSG